MTTPDLVLLAYILLIVPAMLVGFVFARRKMFVPYHKLTMTTITIVNWGLILFVMFVTYRRDVLPQVPQNLNMPGVLVPTLHLIPGLIAQLLATYLVIRMWFENQLPAWFKVNNIKRYMRTTLALWLLTAILGALTWAVINKGLFASAPVVIPSTPQAGVTVIRLVSGNKFDPADISIPTGTTVQFVNVDTKPHTVTADDGSFASGDMKPGAIFSRAFGQPGDVAYFCDFHGDKGHVGMSAVIHVTGNPVAVTNAAPAATQKATESATKGAVAATEKATVNAPASTQKATQNAVAAQTITIKMNDDIFDPKEVTVPVGTVLHFVNNGKHKHTVTADDGSFDSGQMKAGDTFDHTFDKTGDVPLYCQNHGDKGGQGMSMVVHVSNAGAPAATSAATKAPMAATSAATPAAVAVATTAPTAVPTTVQTKAALDPKVVAALTPLVGSADDTPNKTAYAIGMQTQNALIKAQAAIVTDALSKAHYEDAQAAAEAILNITESGAGKDRDGDGKINQPGDGYGLQKYIFSVNENLGTLQTVTGTSDPLHASAGDMLTAGQTALKDLQAVAQQAQALLDAKTLIDARKVEPLLTDAVTKLDGDFTKITQSLPKLP